MIPAIEAFQDVLAVSIVRVILNNPAIFYPLPVRHELEGRNNVLFGLIGIGAADNPLDNLSIRAHLGRNVPGIVCLFRTPTISFYMVWPGSSGLH